MPERTGREDPRRGPARLAVVDWEAFAADVARASDRAGLSRRQLATLAGVSIGTFLRFMAGDGGMTGDAFAAVACACGLSLDNYVRVNEDGDG